MYLAVATRPDIAYVASRLGQFNHCHSEKHWTAAKRVLRYLRGTINLGLYFRYSKEHIVGYADANWGGCLMDRRSYTDYAFLLCSAAISWRSISNVRWLYPQRRRSIWHYRKLEKKQFICDPQCQNLDLKTWRIFLSCAITVRLPIRKSRYAYANKVYRYSSSLCTSINQRK